MPRWMAAPPAVRAAAPVIAVLAVLGLDLVAGARSWPVPVAGLLDEPAHLLTAGLALAAVRWGRRRAWPWVLLGAVAIDVDHVPLYLWGGPVAEAGGRPVTHSLLTVVVLAAVAAAVPRVRPVVAGLAAGVLLHLARDVATGPGVLLWWPVRSSSVLLPYWVEPALLSVLAAIVVARRLHDRCLTRNREAPSAS